MSNTCCRSVGHNPDQLNKLTAIKYSNIDAGLNSFPHSHIATVGEGNYLPTRTSICFLLFYRKKIKRISRGIVYGVNLSRKTYNTKGGGINLMGYF